MARLIAQFAGNRPSLGYQPGQIYELEVWRDQRYIWIRPVAPIGLAPVPYGSSKAMAKNWVIFM